VVVVVVGVVVVAVVVVVHTYIYIYIHVFTSQLKWYSHASMMKCPARFRFSTLANAHVIVNDCFNCI
jgi:hypothetical protein